MRLASTRSADQPDVALLVEESPPARSLERLIDRRAFELEVVEALADGSLATVTWYLIDRASASASA
jgi:hypothetical protein